MNRNKIKSTSSTQVCNKQSEYKLDYLSDHNTQYCRNLLVIPRICELNTP